MRFKIFRTYNYYWQLRLGRDSEDDISPSDSAGYVDIADSDDEDFDPANPDYDDYF